MTNKPINDDSDKQKIEEAWSLMQSKLANEPVNPIWTEWGQHAEQSTPNGNEEVTSVHTTDASTPMVQSVSPLELQGKLGVNTQASPRTKQRGMNRRRKWATVAAGVAVFAAILATPVGNTAMASILNQFRMQDVTVVNESDLRNIFTQITENGDIQESANKFGIFSSSSGSITGDMPLDKISDTLGYAPLSTVVTDSQKTVSVNPSQAITLNLHVDEVNKAMKRLGAEQLLPQSIDGKPITLSIPEMVNYNLSPDKEHWASLSQMNTPTITVDPSIKVEEAVEAIINFPLMPDYLKSSLKQSRILSGEIPMPLIAVEGTEQLTIGSTIVILNHYDSNKETIYDATWVSNGQLFQFHGGDIYEGKEKFIAKLQELIQL
ncbi:hypothetical protein [Paenibacillus wynnii]|uniref:DUF4367 domain-containing protein n=1 Tax=Paenibacillus wynnii TaxID=268407 RepID=A0A098M585_9BACL|nr:hypothetical protein [Paenibacillus wynnii]KGE17198.1 hypothetical protein PWYN_21415 [Paenibacillus wynnii]